MKINLKKIIEENDLNISDLAEQLFPRVKYPKLALNRIISEEAHLDEVQILKLSEILNCSIDSLYGKVTWTSESSDGMVVLKRDGYKAVLNTVDWTTKLYKDGDLVHSEVISSKSILLSEYLSDLNTIISKND